MRNKTVLILMLFFVLSCNKEKEDIIPNNKLTTAKLNGSSWSASTFSSGIRSNGRIGIGFVVQRNGFDRESLGVTTIPARVGLIDNQLIRNDSLIKANYVTLSHDGDVVKDAYRLDKGAESNYFSIDKLDTINKIMEGTFDLTLSIDTNRIKQDPDAPDIIHFSNGEYKVVYK